MPNNIFNNCPVGVVRLFKELEKRSFFMAQTNIFLAICLYGTLRRCGGRPLFGERWGIWTSGIGHGSTTRQRLDGIACRAGAIANMSAGRSVRGRYARIVYTVTAVRQPDDDLRWPANAATSPDKSTTITTFGYHWLVGRTVLNTLFTYCRWSVRFSTTVQKSKLN